MTISQVNQKGGCLLVCANGVREAGDIEQDASLVLGIYNPSMQKAQDEGEDLTEPEVDLKITVLKNRDGIVNLSKTLKFYRPTLTIKEVE